MFFGFVEVNFLLLYSIFCSMCDLFVINTEDRVSWLELLCLFYRTFTFLSYLFRRSFEFLSIVFFFTFTWELYTLKWVHFTSNFNVTFLLKVNSHFILSNDVRMRGWSVLTYVMSLVEFPLPLDTFIPDLLDFNVFSLLIRFHWIIAMWETKRSLSDTLSESGSFPEDEPLSSVVGKSSTYHDSTV